MWCVGHSLGRSIGTRQPQVKGQLVFCLGLHQGIGLDLRGAQFSCWVRSNDNFQFTQLPAYLLVLLVLLLFDLITKVRGFSFDDGLECLAPALAGG